MIQQAKDRISCLVSRILAIWVPENSGYFVTCWTTVIFSEKPCIWSQSGVAFTKSRRQTSIERECGYGRRR